MKAPLQGNQLGFWRHTAFAALGAPLHTQLSARLLAIVLTWAGWLSASAQNFTNLDFENATLIPLAGDPYNRMQFGPALPGWTGYCGTGAQTAVNYDTEFLDSAGVSILDTNYTYEPVAGVTHRHYCVCLYSGVALGGYGGYVETSIAQTGWIPAEALSIWFNFCGSSSWGLPDVRLTFNGISIPLSVVSGGGTGPSVLSGDVSQFANQVGELRFTAPNESTPSRPVNRSIFLLDYIRFPGAPTPPNVPTIVAPPHDQTAAVGSAADFVVGAAGAPPLAYQWFFDGTYAISNATSRDLHLVNLRFSQAGFYSVVIANAFGAATSSPAMLTVTGPPSPPVILTPPSTQAASVGDTVDFSVSADGSPPLSYQWMWNGSIISGAGSSSCRLTNVQLSQSGAYTVVVTNAFGAVTSAPALLTVIGIPPAILSPPRTQTAMAGWCLDLAVSALGSPPLSYQWLFNGSVISGAGDANLHLISVQSAQSGTYSVLVTNAFGAVTSGPAVLSVVPVPPNPPASTVVGWGDTAIPYVARGTRYSAIAAGPLYSLAIKPDGTIIGWGYNGYGQAAAPAGLSNVIAVAAGGYGLPSHSLALKSDGTVVAWGNNSFGQATVPLGLGGVIGVSAGMQHSLALKSNGTVVVWGDNTWGQTNVPASLGGVVAIAAGGYHSLAVKADGTVVAWGDNGWGQTTLPAGLRNVVAVAAAYLHSLALNSDGTVVAWGNNTFGQNTVPAGLSSVIAIAAKGYHSLALKSDGTVVPWGDNYNGEGNVPAGLSNVVAIAAGEEHNVALKADNTIVAWGDNDYGQTIVPGTLGGVIALASGGWMSGHDLALKTDGTVVAWGRIACQNSSWVPTNLSGVVALAAGECHGLALKSDGALTVWGDNWAGQINVPAGLSNVLAIAAGGYHSLAVASDRTVVAWGSNNDQSGNVVGQSTVPPGLSDVTAVAGGEYHSLALKSDGTVVAWGSNNDYQGGYAGQTVVPAGLSGIVAIAAGGFHSLALKSDGTVAAWGNDDFGQCNIPGGVNGVVGIAAGQYHSLALKGDGTVVAWGESTSGTVPVGLPTVLNVVAAGLRSLALVAGPPSVLLPPASQTAEMGSIIRFGVRADGFPPMAYQWYFNGTDALGNVTTNSALALTNIQLAQAGAYTVVVTNAFGGVTSAPALLSVVPRVERRWVPGVGLTGQLGIPLNLEYADALVPWPNWLPLATMPLANTPQFCFDLSVPLPPQRFFRAWQSGAPSVKPCLHVRIVPAITVTGSVGGSVRVDAINQIGPTDAWFTLDTVTLTNTSQLYFDTSAWGQPQRLYRLVPGP